MDETCDGCGKTGIVSWSPAFTAHLCQSCKASRTDTELGTTARANKAAALAGRGDGDE